MAKKNSSNGNRVHIEGNVPGQVAVGSSIQQTQSIGHSRPQVSSADLELLRDQFEQLKAQINQAVPPEQQEKAIEKVTELEEAITDEKPDLSTMEYVRNWFGRNLPQLAGAVTGLVVHPIVGKLVEAAGDALAQEFKRRFEIP